MSPPTASIQPQDKSAAPESTNPTAASPIKPAYEAGADGMADQKPDAAAEEKTTAKKQGPVIAPLPLEPPEPPRVPFECFNPIDAFLAQVWIQSGIRPVPLADEALIIRRLYLDLAGRIPSAEEAARFSVDQRIKNNMRGRIQWVPKLVDELLASEGYVNHWAIYWGDLLREQSMVDGIEPFVMRDYIMDALRTNKPYDQWVREMLSAQGMTQEDPAAAFILRNKANPEDLAVSVSQVFMGVQIQCAQCHNHPFEAWTQKDFEGMRDFWSSTRRRLGRIETLEQNGREVQVRYDRVVSGDDGRGVFLTGATSPLGGGADGLADLVTSAKNPYFARVAVNRVWARLMGAGLVEPVDDFSAERAPSHPELLDWLALEFIRSNYDLRSLIRLICTSRSYQLASSGHPVGAFMSEQRFFEKMPLRRMTAEQLHDSILVLSGRFFGGDGPFRPAIEKRYPQGAGSFLATFASHDRETLHARDAEATIPQALELMNGDFLNTALRMHAQNPVRIMVDEKWSPEAILEQMFYLAYCRPPTPTERTAAMAYLQRFRAQPEDAWTDILWAIVNSREFTFIQ